MPRIDKNGRYESLMDLIHDVNDGYKKGTFFIDDHVYFLEHPHDTGGCDCWMEGNCPILWEGDTPEKTLMEVFNVLGMPWEEV